jgi:hypothetical protein
MLKKVIDKVRSTGGKGIVKEMRLLRNLKKLNH